MLPGVVGRAVQGQVKESYCLFGCDFRLGDLQLVVQLRVSWFEERSQRSTFITNRGKDSQRFSFIGLYVYHQPSYEEAALVLVDGIYPKVVYLYLHNQRIPDGKRRGVFCCSGGDEEECRTRVWISHLTLAYFETTVPLLVSFCYDENYARLHHTSQHDFGSRGWLQQQVV